MKFCNFFILFIGIVQFFVSMLAAAPDPNFHCYLLFGQSNMAGGGNTSGLIDGDCDTTPRVKVLAFCDCTEGSGQNCRTYSSKREHDKWYTAFPPLHMCSEGISPGDWFAKTMLDSIHEDITIGLIPCALSGQSIKVFVKGGGNFNIPTWAHPTIGNNSPYDWMLARCKTAQESGVIKGILFHQGESDPGADYWISTTKGIFDNLKTDLGLNDSLPVVVGELIPSYTNHNPLVRQLADQYPKCGLASSEGLTAKDQYHFNPDGMRAMGKRYAEAFLALADNDYVPRKGTTSAAGGHAKRIRSYYRQNIRSWNGDEKVYSLDGKVLPKCGNSEHLNARYHLRSGNVYLVVRGNGAEMRMVVVP